MWLALTLIAFEVLTTVKYARETAFPAGSHVPSLVIVCWGVAVAALLVWACLRFGVPSWCGGWRMPPALSNLAVVVGVAALLVIAVTQDTLVSPPIGHTPPPRVR